MFNEYFVNIASDLRATSDKMEMDTSKLEDLISSTLDNYITQFNIPPMTEQETLEMIEGLSSGKATGPDAISLRVLKLVAPVFLSPFNKTFQSVLGKRQLS